MRHACEALPTMSNIQLLFAPENTAFAETLASALAAQGYEVSADKNRPASAALVIWSPAAARSKPLLAAARHALSRRVLVPVALDEGAPPPSFDGVRPMDLDGWNGGEDDPRWRFVLDELALATGRGVEFIVGEAANDAAPVGGAKKNRPLSALRASIIEANRAHAPADHGCLSECDEPAGDVETAAEDGAETYAPADEVDRETGWEAERSEPEAAIDDLAPQQAAQEVEGDMQDKTPSAATAAPQKHAPAPRASADDDIFPDNALYADDRPRPNPHIPAVALLAGAAMVAIIAAATAVIVVRFITPAAPPAPQVARVYPKVETIEPSQPAATADMAGAASEPRYQPPEVVTLDESAPAGETADADAPDSTAADASVPDGAIVAAPAIRDEAAGAAPAENESPPVASASGNPDAAIPAPTTASPQVPSLAALTIPSTDEKEADRAASGAVVPAATEKNPAEEPLPARQSSAADENPIGDLAASALPANADRVELPADLIQTAHQAPAPAYFRDCVDCPDMIEIGGASGGISADAAVSAAPFAIGVRDVTVGEWNECVAAGACPRLASSSNGKSAPATGAAGEDIEKYLGWLSLRTGWTYRRASEAESALAASAGAQRSAAGFRIARNF
ncbi:MAG: SUMF1/EgtB/PvdO family nonheme iron enzyme [Parvularculaceae bacterium]